MSLPLAHGAGFHAQMNPPKVSGIDKIYISLSGSQTPVLTSMVTSNTHKSRSAAATTRTLCQYFVTWLIRTADQLLMVTFHRVGYPAMHGFFGALLSEPYVGYPPYELQSWQMGNILHTIRWDIRNI